MRKYSAHYTHLSSVPCLRTLIAIPSELERLRVRSRSRAAVLSLIKKYGTSRAFEQCQDKSIISRNNPCGKPAGDKECINGGFLNFVKTEFLLRSRTATHFKIQEMDTCIKTVCVDVHFFIFHVNANLRNRCSELRLVLLFALLPNLVCRLSGVSWHVPCNPPLTEIPFPM